MLYLSYITHIISYILHYISCILHLYIFNHIFIHIHTYTYIIGKEERGFDGSPLELRWWCSGRGERESPKERKRKENNKEIGNRIKRNNEVFVGLNCHLLS